MKILSGEWGMITLVAFGVVAFLERVEFDDTEDHIRCHSLSMAVVPNLFGNAPPNYL